MHELLEPLSQALEQYESSNAQMRRQIELLQGEIEALHGSHTVITSQVSQQEDEKSSLQEQYEEEKRTLRDLNTAISEQLKKSIEELAAKSAHIETLSQSSDEKDAKIEQLFSEKEQIILAKQRLSESMQLLQSNATQMQSTMQELQEEIENLQEQQSACEKESLHLRQKNSAISGAFESKVEHLENQVAALQSQLQQCEAASSEVVQEQVHVEHLEANDAEVARLNERHMQIIQEKMEIVAINKQLERKIETLEQQMLSNEEHVKVLKQAHEEQVALMQKSVLEKEVAIDQLNNKISLLDAQHENEAERIASLQAELQEEVTLKQALQRDIANLADENIALKNGN